MPDYTNLESHADLGGCEMFPDDTEDLRCPTDAPSAHRQSCRTPETRKTPERRPARNAISSASDRPPIEE